MNNIDKIAENWNQLISKIRCKMNLSELEFSALSSWIIDCHESTHRIYYDLLQKIDKYSTNDSELLFDIVFEIYSDLNHIKDHIQEAENGFIEMIKVLEENNE